jgi:hypothetical protein
LRQNVRLLGDREPMAFAFFSRKDSNIPVSNEIWRLITDKELWTVRDVFLLEHKCMTTETVNMLFQFFAFETSEEAQTTVVWSLIQTHVLLQEMVVHAVFRLNVHFVHPMVAFQALIGATTLTTG